ncbi:sn-glycerol-3-phosphate ABC transporter ATP-binding protein UgpC [Frankia sp. RB7]|nr:sn-glycerol-3-phosphate ABC transporter ATP-binding protein UgpC [Frankia sp. RB7]
MADVLLRNVVKRYGAYQAVHGINLEIPDTKFVALVGPSGCGKTTTLRMIAGLEDVSAGEIRIGGRVVNDVAPKNRDIAMVFQSYALYPHMTVFQNMSFGLRMRGMSKADIRKSVEDAARVLDIYDLLGRRPKELSGGQKQRAAMGRAMVRNPKVFLFDEPLSNLDAKLRVQMRTEIKRVHQQVKTTTIYVTHDQIEAMTLADYVVVMNRGRIEQVGTPHELYHAPKTRFVAGFMGSPAMNFISCTIERNASALSIRLIDGAVFPVPESRLQRYEPLAGKSLIFGLRPEHITEARSSDRENYSEFDTMLDVVEPMGTEAMVFFRLGDTVVSGRVDTGVSVPEAGAKIRLAANMTHMHLIDPETDQVL